MAAPTSVRVEATSITSTIIRWTYSGTGDMAVYRSTDGVSYSEITVATSTRILAGTTSYEDTGLTLGTKYWYKLSDDEGSTFSDVVTVWTHNCAGPIGEQTGVDLPPFLRAEDMTPERLNEMERRIEAALNGQQLAPEQCIACPEDGAVAIDCSSGCINWTIIADADINSISINWCDRFDGNIDFVIPPNTTVGICGFPAGFGFGGDECTQAPLSGGTNGRTMSVGFSGGGAGGGGAAGKGAKSSPGVKLPKGSTGGSGSGGGGGGSGCTCVPRAGNALTIKSCNADNSLKCASTQSLRLIACGGRGPYSWSKTGSITLQKGSNGTAGATVTGSSEVIVKPPTNSGSGVAGTAYKLGKWIRCTAGGGITGNRMFVTEYGCDDAVEVACQAYSANSALVDPTPDCIYCGETGAACTGGMTDAVVERTVANCTVAPTCENGDGTLCDKRTAGMISNNCAPCGLQHGSTVTVTDSLGTSVSITVRR